MTTTTKYSERGPFCAKCWGFVFACLSVATAAAATEIYVKEFS